jgi:hypothetical protein
MSEGKEKARTLGSDAGWLGKPRATYTNWTGARQRQAVQSRKKPEGYYSFIFHKMKRTLLRNQENILTKTKYNLTISKQINQLHTWEITLGTGDSHSQLKKHFPAWTKTWTFEQNHGYGREHMNCEWNTTNSHPGLYTRARTLLKPAHTPAVITKLTIICPPSRLALLTAHIVTKPPCTRINRE